MTRVAFLEELRLALQGSISQAQVNENLKYYENYIMEQSHMGKSEEQVMEELGSPRLIARTILDTSEHIGESYEESFYEETQEETIKKGFHVEFSEAGGWDIRWGKFKINSWYGTLFIVMLIVLVFVIIAKVFVFLLPVLIPLLIAWLIVMLILSSRK